MGFKIFFNILKSCKWGEGVQPHFCPSPNPDFDVSWGKMCKNGKKVYGKRGKKYSF